MIQSIISYVILSVLLAAGLLTMSTSNMVMADTTTTPADHANENNMASGGTQPTTSDTGSSSPPPPPPNGGCHGSCGKTLPECATITTGSCTDSGDISSPSPTVKVCHIQANPGFDCFGNKLKTTSKSDYAIGFKLGTADGKVGIYDPPGSCGQPQGVTNQNACFAGYKVGYVKACVHGKFGCGDGPSSLPTTRASRSTSTTTTTTTSIMPTTINPSIQGAQLVNSSVYLNKTDGDYHLKGYLRNTLAESRDFITITASFFDIKTGNTLSMKVSSVGGIFGTPHVSPGAAVPFDMDTGYKSNEANQLAGIRVMLTV